MLSHLKLQDLILVEKAEIEFGEGLNIVTGETGSGKSAILAAIRLLSGERADSEWVRLGAKTAFVEGVFTSIEPHPSPPSLESDSVVVLGSVIVRRELSQTGKSRCFIDDRLVNASDLRDFMRTQLEMVDQSSSTTLAFPETQRKIVDIYAGLEKEVRHFSEKFAELMKAKNELEAIQAAEERRVRDFEWAKSSLKAIEDVHWQKEEEEHLTQIHHLLSHSQELTKKIASAMEGLSQISLALRPVTTLIEAALRLDPRLASCFEAIKTASIELDESERNIRSYASHIEADPTRLAAIEIRIGEIESLKRRYGASWEEVEGQRAHFAREIERIGELDALQNDLISKVKQLEEETATQAKLLSEKRQRATHSFIKAVLSELQCLNIPHAQFEVQFKPKPLSSNGIDEIRFLFSANPGLPPLPLDRAPSGGELSRLLFAAKITNAEKEKTQSLVFDEIDSNVGGQTAAVLGEKLKQLSQKRQVVCVTHFVQVARHALHHFSVVKKEQNGRAATYIQRLQPSEREREYARMVGTYTHMN